jgi:hypothetical protein
MIELLENVVFGVAIVALIGMAVSVIRTELKERRNIT